MGKIKGLAYLLGDDINTDDIIPSHVLTARDPNEMVKYVLEFRDPDFVKKKQKDTIIVAGENFGTGSSREEAVHVFKMMNISAIIAKSFARIYFRNMINLGILPILLNWEKNIFNNGDLLEIYPKEGKIVNITKKLEYTFEKIPPFLMKFMEAGGILNYLKNKQ